MSNPTFIFTTEAGETLFFSSASPQISSVFRLAKETIKKIPNEVLLYQSMHFSCADYIANYEPSKKGFVLNFNSGRKGITQVLRENRRFNRNFDEDYLAQGLNQDPDLSESEKINLDLFVSCINLLTEI